MNGGLRPRCPFRKGALGLVALVVVSVVPSGAVGTSVPFALVRIDRASNAVIRAYEFRNPLE
jgi:hypothetical protein